MNKLSTLALLFLAFSVAVARDNPINKVCPIKGTPVNASSPSSVYMGKTIAFCCNNCKGMFDANPAKFANAIAADMKAADAKKSDKPDAKSAAAKATGPCDCKKIVKGFYCEMCKRELAPEDVRNGTCKRDETKPIQIEFCLKLIPKTLSKQEIKEGKPPYDEDKARISYECETCGAKGDIESQIKHKPDCKPKALGSGLKKICAKSGKYPHATEDK
jgi:YHS domain-containing protein